MNFGRMTSLAHLLAETLEAVGNHGAILTLALTGHRSLDLLVLADAGLKRRTFGSLRAYINVSVHRSLKNEGMRIGEARHMKRVSNIPAYSFPQGIVSGVKEVASTPKAVVAHLLRLIIWLVFCRVEVTVAGDVPFCCRRWKVGWRRSWELRRSESCKSKGEYNEALHDYRFSGVRRS